MKVSFNIVAAMDLNRGIGKGGRLPWHLTADLKHFRDLTTKTDDDQKKNVVIMGRKTWESLPEKFRPLPDRINIVLTRNKEFKFPQTILSGGNFKDIFKILEAPSRHNKAGEIFIIGGEQIFSQAVQYPECQRIYATHLQKSFDCDTFFPDFKNDFKEISRSSMLKENSLEFFFAEYIRRH